MPEIGHLFFVKKLFTNPIFCGIIIKLAQQVHNNHGGDCLMDYFWRRDFWISFGLGVLIFGCAVIIAFNP